MKHLKKYNENFPLYTYRPEPLSEKEKVKDFIGNKLGKNYFVSCVDDGIQIYGKHQQSVEYIKDKVAKILNVSSEYLTTYFNTIIITDSNLNLILKKTKNKII